MIKSPGPRGHPRFQAPTSKSTLGAKVGFQARVRGTHELRTLLLEGVAQARRLNKPVLVSRTERIELVDPLAAFDAACALSAERSFWQAPDGFSLVGVGSAAWMPAVPPRQVARTWQEALEGSIQEGEEAPGTGPVLLGVFPFDVASVPSPLWSPLMTAGQPVSGAHERRFNSLTLPRWLLTSTPEGAWLTVNDLATPHVDAEALAQRLARAAHYLAQRPEGSLGFEVRSTARARGDGEHAYPDPAGWWVRAPAREAPTASWFQADEAPAEWVHLVQRAKAAIKRGEAEKIVLARSTQVEVGEPDASGALARLRDRYPGCWLFAVARGQDCFLGASPERLVRLDEGVVQVSALAGTAPRGTTPEEDQRLGNELLRNAKDQAEHAVVVRMVREALAGCCGDLTIPPAPTLMKLRNVQHLSTPITGRLLTDDGVLGLVERLHPTPAVAGFPQSAAMRFLREYEGVDRGLYAGAVGWVDHNGDGEFAVAIRSALLHGISATLYAGCGIMVDSDARREYEETCLKLQPMLSALEGSPGLDDSPIAPGHRSAPCADPEGAPQAAPTGRDSDTEVRATGILETSRLDSGVREGQPDRRLRP